MKQLLWVAFAIIGLLAACKKNNDKPGMAVVTTTAPTGITSSGAQTGGTITSNGNSIITQSGICWALHNTPTLGDSVVNGNTTSTGAFSITLNDLNANTVYYFRAFVTNGVGTAYGAVDSFTTAAGVPTLTTTAISNNAELAANSGGSITNNGGASVTVSGICWATSTNPSVSNFKTIGTAINGSFSDTLVNLVLGNTYYVRAYATNSFGTGYGNQISFTVSSTGTVTDIDGNAYATVVIGTQTWITSNLRITHYQNGDPLVNAFTNIGYDWINGTNGGGYTFVNGDTTSVTLAAYGLLYSSWAVTDSRNIAPVGWHVATLNDWEILEAYEGLPAADTVAAYALNNSPFTDGAIGPILQTGGNSGLNLQLAGYYYGTFGGALNFGLRGYYWTSTPYNSIYDYNTEVYGPTSGNYQGVLLNYSGGGNEALSVRCVKD
jgi:uncharacterized protein (TIGR02145 family)